MYSPLLVLLLLQSPAALTTLERGAHLQYAGNFVAERGEAGATEKAFQLSLFIAESDGDRLKVYWTLDEQGHGAWSWLDRFGLADARRDSTDHQAKGPALLYVRPQGTSVVPILFPLLHRPDKLAELSPGSAWSEQRLEYRVEQAARLADRDAWRIAVTNAYGRKQTIWVDQSTRIILAAEETVFIGQGEKHLLRLGLVSEQSLSSTQADPTFAAFDSLINLRGQLGVAPRTREVVWSRARLRLLDQHLPKLEKQAAVKPLAKLVQAVALEVKRQENRTGAIASVKTRLVGRAAPHPKLTDLRGATFDWGKTKDKVTVLHFWEYRDVPLEEPYGQTAYVDFLFRNRKPDQVDVVGIAVDDRLADPSTRNEGVRSVKKFRSFMNLSYPILLDSGQAIGQYGDPRATGAKLPLFVVLDRTGRVTHYHVGNYEIQRDRGLEELDEVVKRALGNPE